MHLGIVSDTHDNIEVAEQAADAFAEAGVDAVVHCGDIVAPFTAAVFDRGFDFHAVRGNNDGEWALADAVADFGTYHGETAELTLDGREVAVYHGTSGAVVEALVDCGHYDYVLHGHTHEFAHESRAGTTRINPGGIAIEAAPESPSAVVLDVETGEIERHGLE
jgi:putative phosphoesterase